MLILHVVNIRGHRLTSPHFHDNAAKIVRDNDVVFRRCPMLLTVQRARERFRDENEKIEKSDFFDDESV